MKRALIVLAGLALGACSTPQTRNDPLEDLNRAVFAFNGKVDDYVLVPVSRAYRATLPEGARNAVHNATANLKEPVTFVNDVLQGEFENASHAFYRFGVNSTLGGAGLFDIAAKNEHIGPHTEDFGQTLGVYGVGGGPYMVLPILGPSNARDTAGLVVDYFIDPISQIRTPGRKTAQLGATAAAAIDKRSRNLNSVQALHDGSVDFYASERSVYEQHRESDIHNGTIDPGDLPDF